ncbi:hypothetical protein [Cellulomonas sp. URHB0016]
MIRDEYSAGSDSGPSNNVRGRNEAPRMRAACPRTLRGWTFSTHAQRNIDARGFAPDDVVDACEHHEIAMTADNYEPGRKRYVRGELVVIAAPARLEIITVLLRSHESWNDADARKVTGS